MIESTYTATISQGTTAAASTHVNTYLTGCFPTGGASMELLVLSDTTGMPVQQGGLDVSAVFSSGCNNVPEIVYFDNVTSGSGGWIGFPHQSPDDDDIAGRYNFSLTYEGQTYFFQGFSHPASTTCMTIKLPSGVVTSASYEFSSQNCAGIGY